MKIKKVYLGRRQIYPDWEWEPGENTVFYIKWEWDIKDYWPNNYQFTNNLVTITDDYLNFPGTSKNRLINTTASIPQTYTFNARLYITWVWTSISPRIIAPNSNDSAVATYRWSWWTLYTVSYNNRAYNWPVLPTNTWINFVVTRVQWGQSKIYVNAVNSDTETSASINYGTWIVLWCKYASDRDSYQGRMARIILENKEWTAQEVADYFDQTKSKYWL